MRRLFTFFIVALFAQVVFAGGILTNSNQSAQFVRMLSRNASLQIDGVYFNPAGLVMLEDGLHFSVSNQTIFQSRTINSGFSYLNEKEYKGEVFAPVFPDVYAVYKNKKWAFSAGFGPNGGGGSAKYNTGLPSFEKQIAAIPSSLTTNGIPTTKYSTDIQFEGESVFYGTQLNASYAISDKISLSAGVRMLNAKNKYSGYLKDIMINPNYPAFGTSYTGNMVSAPKFFTDGETFLKGLASSATSAANSLSGMIGNGTLPAAAPLTALPAANQTAIAQLLGAAGISTTGMNVGTAVATLNATSPIFTAKANVMKDNSTGTANKEVDTEQLGTGFTPIIGFNISLEKLNIGLKYEFQTNLILTNATKVDGTGLFKNNEKSHSDIPAILAAGADYLITDAFKISGSYNMYFDKNVNWGQNVYNQERLIDNNYIELALGIEYHLSDRFALSGGFLNSNTGVSEQYQSDFSYSNDSSTGAFGLEYKIGKKLTFDAGVMLTKYKDANKEFTSGTTGYSETYGKATTGFAIGISYSIF